MENNDFVDQRRNAVQRFFTGHRDELAKCGAILPTYRRRGGRHFGPYYKLTCRVSRRQFSVYLGTDSKLIDDVRKRLSQLQQSRSVHRRFVAARRTLRQQAQLARLQLDVQLAPLGLYRKGHEIRGWRTAARRPRSQPCEQ